MKHSGQGVIHTIAVMFCVGLALMCAFGFLVQFWNAPTLQTPSGNTTPAETESPDTTEPSARDRLTTGTRTLRRFKPRTPHLVKILLDLPHNLI